MICYGVSTLPTIPWKKVVERLQEFVEGLNQENNTKISIEVEEKVKALQLDMRVRHELLILFKEGIHHLLNTGAQICKIRLKIVLSVFDFSIEFIDSEVNHQSIKCTFESKELAQLLDNMKAYLDIRHQEKHSVIQIKIAL